MQYRVGVLEWASCGGVADVDRLPESIRREGWDMCRTLIEHLSAAGCMPVACLWPGLASQLDLENIISLATDRDTRAQWLAAYRTCDVTIVIAPETDNVLQNVEAWCAQSGIRTSGCDAAFIACASDKWQTAKCWRAAEVPHPLTMLLADWTGKFDDETVGNAWVVKARDGCGCDGTRRVTVEQLDTIANQTPHPAAWIVQPWIAGSAYSRSVIVDTSGQWHWLPVVTQQIQVDAENGDVRYLAVKSVPISHWMMRSKIV